MVNASSLYRVHAFMLVKVTKLVKLSTLNVKTAFVMLIVLSAVLINRAGELVQFSETLISLHLIISDLISKEHAATFSLAQQPVGLEIRSWSLSNLFHVDHQESHVHVTLS